MIDITLNKQQEQVNDVQNGDINHRVQVIKQNQKDIPFLYPLIHFLLILNRYIEKNRYIKIFDIEVDDTIQYDISISKRYFNIFDISTYLYAKTKLTFNPIQFNPLSSDGRR